MIELGNDIHWINVDGGDFVRLEANEPSWAPTLGERQATIQAARDLEVLSEDRFLGEPHGGDGIDGIRETWSALEREGHWGDVVSLERIYRRLDIVAASAPAILHAKTSTSFNLTRETTGGLTLKLGGFGLGGTVTYQVSTQLGITCSAGEAKIGFLLVPVDKEVREWFPPGAAESFPVTSYKPVPGPQRFGTGAGVAAVDELLEGRRSTVPIRGNTSHSSSVSDSVSVGFSIELGKKWADDANSLSLTASLSGTVEIDVGYEVPAGSFELAWLDRPAGACLTVS